MMVQCVSRNKSSAKCWPANPDIPVINTRMSSSDYPCCELCATIDRVIDLNDRDGVLGGSAEAP